MVRGQLGLRAIRIATLDEGADVRDESNMNRRTLAGFAVFGVILILLGTARFGAATSPDSIAYASAADNLTAGLGFYLYNGGPLLFWPPAFPTVLALVKFTGLDPLTGARFVNAVVYGLIIFTGGCCLRRTATQKSLVLLATMALLFAFPLIYVAVYAWSEIMFVLFVVLFLHQADRFEDNKWMPHVLWATLFAALACMTRYVGVTAIATGIIVLLLNHRQSLGRRLALAATFAIAAFTPLALWLARNLFVTSTLTGQRKPSTASPLENLHALLDAVGVWFIPPQLGDMLRIGFVVCVFALVVCLGVLASRRSSDGTAVMWHPARCPFAWFVVIYATFLTISASLVKYDPIDYRLTSPLYVPFLVVMHRAFQYFVHRNDDRSTTRLTRRLPALACALWVLYLALGSALIVRQYGWQGGGFSRPRWRNSAVLTYIREHPEDGFIRSNCPSVIFFHTGQAAQYPPDPVGETGWNRWFTDTNSEATSSLLVWWKSDVPAYSYGIDDVHRHVKLELLHESHDGDIYRIVGSH